MIALAASSSAVGAPALSGAFWRKGHPAARNTNLCRRRRSNCRCPRPTARLEEPTMKGDTQVIEYLNKALRHELTAVNQYWLHYRLLDNWGYKALAKKWRKESIEEMEHADKLTVRIIFLEGFPNMQVLDPLHIGRGVKEVLDCDLQAEMSARRSMKRPRLTATRSRTT
jgi:bacterioferritin